MIRALLRMFDYSGRSTRWEYWSFLIGFAVVLIGAGAWVASYQDAHFGMDPQLDDGAAAIVGLAALVLLAAPHLALKVRRYHDFGWSGWAVLWSFVPLVNIFMEFMLLFRGSAPGLVAAASYPEPQHINIYNNPGATTGSAGAARDSHVDQIARLADMHANGQLTAQEFAAAKARVLGN